MPSTWRAIRFFLKNILDINKDCEKKSIRTSSVVGGQTRNLKLYQDERLTKANLLESEILSLELENKNLAKENKINELTLVRLKNRNENLNLQIKGMKHKVLNSQKNKNILTSKLNTVRKEIYSTNKDLEIYKMNVNHKLKLVHSNIKHTKIIKDERKNDLMKKYETEISNNDILYKSVKENKTKINNMRNYINVVDKKQEKSKIKIFKSTAEMGKFLNEI